MKVPANGGIVTTVPHRIRPGPRGNLFEARFKTRLVTLSGDSYDDLIVVEHTQESQDTRAAYENDSTTDIEEDDMQGYEE